MSKNEGLVHQAVKFATFKHSGVDRKISHLPYIVHPVAVLSRIAVWGVEGEVTRAAAVLHDVVEDTDATIDELVERFGQPVADIVEDLTFREQTENESKSQYQEAKMTYLASFGNKSTQAIVIKIADRIENTIDFLLSDSRYARKYWGKAEETLFPAMFLSQDRITNYFGLKVWHNIMYDYWSIHKKCSV